MVAAIGFSALLALSLTPALCATMLKPVAAGHDHAGARPVRLVQPPHGRGQRRLCRRGCSWSLMRAGRLMLIYAVLLAGRRLAFVRLARRFSASRRPGLHHDRRADAARRVVSAHPSVVETRRGLSDEARRCRHGDLPDRLQLSRSGQEHRAGLHHPEGLVGAAQADSAGAIVADINRTFAPLRDGRVSALQPPPIDNLGNSTGFSFRLQDRGQRGYAD